MFAKPLEKIARVRSKENMAVGIGSKLRFLRRLLTLHWKIYKTCMVLFPQLQVLHCISSCRFGEIEFEQLKRTKERGEERKIGKCVFCVVGT